MAAMPSMMVTIVTFYAGMVKVNQFIRPTCLHCAYEDGWKRNPAILGSLRNTSYPVKDVNSLIQSLMSVV